MTCNFSSQPEYMVLELHMDGLVMRWLQQEHAVSPCRGRDAMGSGEDRLLEEIIKNESTILQCAEGTEGEGAFCLRFSFGIAAPCVRWISLYFLPHSQFSLRKLGTYQFIGSEEDVTTLKNNIGVSIDPPGVLRARVYYEGFGLWEYSREILRTVGNSSSSESS